MTMLLMLLTKMMMTTTTTVMTSSMLECGNATASTDAIVAQRPHESRRVK
jgi:hypothetical protein